MEEVEVACLMRVLTKPNLENAILLKELVVIMENFGIYDEEDGESHVPEGPEGDDQDTSNRLDSNQAES